MTTLKDFGIYYVTGASIGFLGYLVGHSIRYQKNLLINETLIGGTIVGVTWPICLPVFFGIEIFQFVTGTKISFTVTTITKKQ